MKDLSLKLKLALLALVATVALATIIVVGLDEAATRSRGPSHRAG